jgi:hypothetical protein
MSTPEEEMSADKKTRPWSDIKKASWDYLETSGLP